MKVYAIALAAGVPFRTERFGRYFRLVSTSAPLVVNLYKRNAIVYDADQVEGGFWAMPDDGFDAFELVSAGVQTVYVGISLGNAGYDRSQGSVQITGPLNAGWVGVSIPNISTTYTDNFAGRYSNAREMLFTEDLGLPASASSYVSTTNMAANTPETILAPGSNVNGAIVWSAQTFTRNATGPTQAIVLAKASAPTNVADGIVVAGPHAQIEVSGGGLCIGITKATRTVRVASGLGVYTIVAIAEGNSHKSARFSAL